MITKNTNILDYLSYLKEMRGTVVKEPYNEVDEYGASKIINDFMTKIYESPNEDYDDYVLLFSECIGILYRPDGGDRNVYGLTINDKIYIYKEVNSDNFLQIKYTLAHEITHMIHQILSRNDAPYDKLNTLGKLRRNLLDKGNFTDSTYFNHILYLIDTNEVFARNQNAYYYAFKEKTEHPNSSDHEIVNIVFRRMGMTEMHLSFAKKDLKNNEDAFNCIISLLVGQFFELGKSGIQSFFDKSVFQLDVVKKMRNEMRDIVYNNPSIENMTERTKEMMEKYNTELNENKSEIVDSFLKHFDDWFYKAKDRLRRSIYLGIEDATIE